MVSGKIIKTMIRGRQDQGRSLYVNNWNTSPMLFKQLVDKGTNACEKVRINRKYLPKVNTTGMKAGEVLVFNSPKMSFFCWEDKKLVNMFSTKQYAEMVSTDRRKWRTGQIIKNQMK